MRIFIMGIIMILMLSVSSVSGKGLRFAIVPKEERSAFYFQSKIGGMDAAAKLPNVTCIYRGPKEEDTREQNDIVEELVREGVDGIAVAVIRSENLAGRGMQKAKAAGIPVISYDADFNTDTLNKYKELRLAYIGSDNFEIGKMLGERGV